MINVPASVLRVFGFVAAVIGIAGLLLVGWAIYDGGAELLSTPGAVLLLFLFSLSFLATLAGGRMAVRPIDQSRRSLVPGWALVASGTAMLITIAVLVYFRGTTGSVGGLLVLGALGVIWLRRGLRNVG